MIAMLAGYFAKPAVKYGAIAIGVLLLFVAGWLAYSSTYNKGSAAGAVKVTSAVQADTIGAVEKARVEKEKADEAARITPYSDVVDGLR